MSACYRCCDCPIDEWLIVVVVVLLLQRAALEPDVACEVRPSTIAAALLV